MKKEKKPKGKKSLKKSLLKEIENKISETVKSYNRKISAKKLDKQIRKAGKILVKSLTLEQIVVVHKGKNKPTKKEKKAPEQEVVAHP
ncbi:MAG TPA: hypothetical protein VII28_12070 [Puia sp.]